MFKSFTSKPLWVHILVVIGITLLLVLLFFFSLDWITNHANNEKVPNIVGQNITAATKILEAKGFEVNVQDSVFVDSIPRLAVVKQSPEGDANVKAGRTIYLTVNRAFAPEVEMPSLIGFSIKSAQLYLQSLSLKLGDTTFRPDIARNSVLEQWYNGQPIIAGTKIPMGSTISFVLGSGLGSGEILVPDIVGMTVQQALELFRSMSINKGSVISQGAIIDTLNSFIVDQNPKVFSETTPGQKTQNKIKPGQVIDIYISSTAPIKAVDTTTFQTPQ